MKYHDLSYEDIENAYFKRNYKFFYGAYDLNIFGIRSSSRIAGEFDDWVGVAYMDDNKKPHLELFKATTDPGSKWLFKPLHPKGTIIMLPGQYRSAYQIGIHGRTWVSGGYPAFEQVGDMRYVRDNNKDNILDIKGNEFKGVYKTNIHRASKNSIVDKVGSYSAGCQVIQDSANLDRLLTLGRKQLDRGLPNRFTYTLFDEKNIFA